MCGVLRVCEQPTGELGNTKLDWPKWPRHNALQKNVHRRPYRDRCGEYCRRHVQPIRSVKKLSPSRRRVILPFSQDIVLSNRSTREFRPKVDDREPMRIFDRLSGTGVSLITNNKQLRVHSLGHILSSCAL